MFGALYWFKLLVGNTYAPKLIATFHYLWKVGVLLLLSHFAFITNWILSLFGKPGKFIAKLLNLSPVIKVIYFATGIFCVWYYSIYPQGSVELKTRSWTETIFVPKLHANGTATIRNKITEKQKFLDEKAVDGSAEDKRDALHFRTNVEYLEKNNLLYKGHRIAPAAAGILNGIWNRKDRGGEDFMEGRTYNAKGDQEGKDQYLATTTHTKTITKKVEKKRKKTVVKKDWNWDPTQNSWEAESKNFDPKNIKGPPQKLPQVTPINLSFNPVIKKTSSQPQQTLAQQIAQSKLDIARLKKELSQHKLTTNPPPLTNTPAPISIQVNTAPPWYKDPKTYAIVAGIGILIWLFWRDNPGGLTDIRGRGKYNPLPPRQNNSNPSQKPPSDNNSGGNAGGNKQQNNGPQNNQSPPSDPTTPPTLDDRINDATSPDKIQTAFNYPCDDTARIHALRERQSAQKNAAIMPPLSQEEEAYRKDKIDKTRTKLQRVWRALAADYENTKYRGYDEDKLLFDEIKRDYERKVVFAKIDEDYWANENNKSAVSKKTFEKAKTAILKRKNKARRKLRKKKDIDILNDHRDFLIKKGKEADRDYQLRTERFIKSVKHGQDLWIAGLENYYKVNPLNKIPKEVHAYFEDDALLLFHEDGDKPSVVGVELDENGLPSSAKITDRTAEFEKEAGSNEAHAVKAAFSKRAPFGTETFNPRQRIQEVAAQLPERVDLPELDKVEEPRLTHKDSVIGNSGVMDNTMSFFSSKKQLDYDAFVKRDYEKDDYKDEVKQIEKAVGVSEEVIRLAADWSKWEQKSGDLMGQKNDLWSEERSLNKKANDYTSKKASIDCRKRQLEEKYRRHNNELLNLNVKTSKHRRAVSSKGSWISWIASNIATVEGPNRVPVGIPTINQETKSYFKKKASVSHLSKSEKAELKKLKKERDELGDRIEEAEGTGTIDDAYKESDNFSDFDDGIDGAMQRHEELEEKIRQLRNPSERKKLSKVVDQQREEQKKKAQAEYNKKKQAHKNYKRQKKLRAALGDADADYEEAKDDYDEADQKLYALKEAGVRKTSKAWLDAVAEHEEAEEKLDTALEKLEKAKEKYKKKGGKGLGENVGSKQIKWYDLRRRMFNSYDKTGLAVGKGKGNKYRKRPHLLSGFNPKSTFSSSVLRKYYQESTRKMKKRNEHMSPWLREVKDTFEPITDAIVAMSGPVGATVVAIKHGKELVGFGKELYDNLKAGGEALVDYKKGRDKKYQDKRDAEINSQLPGSSKLNQATYALKQAQSKLSSTRKGRMVQREKLIKEYDKKLTQLEQRKVDLPYEIKALTRKYKKEKIKGTNLAAYEKEVGSGIGAADYTAVAVATYVFGPPGTLVAGGAVALKEVYRVQTTKKKVRENKRAAIARDKANLDKLDIEKINREQEVDDNERALAKAKKDKKAEVAEFDKQTSSEYARLKNAINTAKEFTERVKKEEFKRLEEERRKREAGIKSDKSKEGNDAKN